MSDYGIYLRVGKFYRAHNLRPNREFNKCWYKIKVTCPGCNTTVEHKLNNQELTLKCSDCELDYGSLDMDMNFDQPEVITEDGLWVRVVKIDVDLANFVLDPNVGLDLINWSCEIDVKGDPSVRIERDFYLRNGEFLEAHDYHFKEDPNDNTVYQNGNSTEDGYDSCGWNCTDPDIPSIKDVIARIVPVGN